MIETLGSSGQNHSWQERADRADVRQYRHRTRLRRRRAGLSADPHHAGDHVDRAPQDAAAARRRTGADRRPEGHEGAQSPRREELASTLPDAIIPQQFENPANPEIHRKTTAEEIWNDTRRQGGYLRIRHRHRRHDHRCWPGAEAPQFAISRLSLSSRPTRPVLSGGNPGPHKIQGIGAGFAAENSRHALSMTKSSPSRNAEAFAASARSWPSSKACRSASPPARP